MKNTFNKIFSIVSILAFTSLNSFATTADNQIHKELDYLKINNADLQTTEADLNANGPERGTGVIIETNKFLVVFFDLDTGQTFVKKMGNGNGNTLVVGDIVNYMRIITPNGSEMIHFLN